MILRKCRGGRWVTQTAAPFGLWVGGAPSNDQMLCRELVCRDQHAHLRDRKETYFAEPWHLALMITRNVTFIMAERQRGMLLAFKGYKDVDHIIGICHHLLPKS